MATQPIAQLIGAWHPAGRAPAHRRLAALLAAIEDDASHDDTLGQRNRRLFRLHRAVVGTPLEARVTCTRCGVDNEFAVPVDAILATPEPAPDARARVESGGTVLTFRLPRMSDIEAATGAETTDAVRRAVLEQCRIDGDLESLSESGADRLGQEFEAQDPAANIVVNIACYGCRQPLAASVDVAGFVARDLDRTLDRLYEEIHVIASAYGWDEGAILALPTERRRRYVSMIAARTPARAQVAARSR